MEETVSGIKRCVKDENRALYEPYLPEHYDTCFCNPAYAVKCFGMELGQLLSFLAMELYSVTEDAFLGEYASVQYEMPPLRK